MPQETADGMHAASLAYKLGYNFRLFRVLVRSFWVSADDDDPMPKIVYRCYAEALIAVERIPARSDQVRSGFSRRLRDFWLKFEREWMNESHRTCIALRDASEPECAWEITNTRHPFENRKWKPLEQIRKSFIAGLEPRHQELAELGDSIASAFDSQFSTDNPSPEDWSMIKLGELLGRMAEGEQVPEGLDLDVSLGAADTDGGRRSFPGGYDAWARHKALLIHLEILRRLAHRQRSRPLAPEKQWISSTEAVRLADGFGVRLVGRV